MMQESDPANPNLETPAPQIPTYFKAGTLNTDQLESLLTRPWDENSLKNCEYEIGIDEAGRGPVIGPMIYGGACWPVPHKKELANIGFVDSKQVKTESMREKFFDAVHKLQSKKLIHTKIITLSAEYISHIMHAENNDQTLNTVSHNSAIEIIRHFISLGLKVTHAYIDTVGIAEKYQSKLEYIFRSEAPDLKFTVTSKADDLFRVVSAASLVAKVTRDRSIRDWKFVEKLKKNEIDKNYGNGYTSQPLTKNWLRDNFEPLFGYPSVVRFSWKTVTPNMFDEKGMEFEFFGDCDLDSRIITLVRAKQFQGDFMHRVNHAEDFEL